MTRDEAADKFILGIRALLVSLQEKSKRYDEIYMNTRRRRDALPEGDDRNALTRHMIDIGGEIHGINRVIGRLLIHISDYDRNMKDANK